MDQHSYAVVDGHILLTPELSATLGIPNGIPFWKYNLSRAAGDPSGYAHAMRSMTSAALHHLITMYDNLELIARRQPGLIVPERLTEDLHNILDRVRADIRSEAARRGLTLVPWAVAEGMRQ